MKRQVKLDKIRPFPPEWLERFSETQLERLAIMTIDCGLTDNEAFQAMNLSKKEKRK